jgi:hypothetical protein
VITGEIDSKLTVLAQMGDETQKVNALYKTKILIEKY